jgi:hypothetical protein
MKTLGIALAALAIIAFVGCAAHNGVGSSNVVAQNLASSFTKATH